jgi:glycine/sarcosine N-methyltransferase
MDLYDALADIYGDIFPLSAERVEFVCSLLPQGNAHIMDVGCATGDLALALARRNIRVTAIDRNKKMINIARHRARRLNVPVDFKEHDMSHLSGIGSACYDLVVCFGNTLPHLRTWPAVDSFFSAVHRLLTENGSLVFQVLGYDKIMAEAKVDFSRINSGDYVFTREYEIVSPKKIIFQAALTNKKTNKTLKGTVPLLPLTGERLQIGVNRAGFAGLAAYKDYNFSPTDGTEFTIIYTARKQKGA